MTEQISVNEASQTLRHAMRETVKRHRWWYHIQGVLMVFAGIVAILYPLFTTVAAAAFLGWMLIFTGIFQGISLIGAQNVPHFWLQLLSLVLAVIVGFLFIRNPGAGVGTLTLLLIVYFMVEGMSKIVFSLTIRPFPNWGWVLASGVIGVLLAFYLISSPASAVWLLGVLIGIQLISEGAALGYMAWNVESA